MRLFISLLVLFIVSVNAQAQILQCPETIKSTQSLQNKAAGWEAFVDNNTVYPLSRVTFFALHPKNQASLTPDQEKPKNNQLTWTFGKEEIWLACGYNNTSLQLIQKLPESTKSCVVTYDSSLSIVEKIECKA